MWKILRFVESFKKGRRTLGPEYGHQLIEKIKDLARKAGVENPFKEVIFLSDLAKNLGGIIFVEYDDEHDKLLSGIFRENYIRHDSIREQDVLNMKQHSKQATVKTHSFVVGDVVRVTDGIYKDTVGRVNTLSDFSATVNVRLFGADHQIEEQFSNLAKEDI